MTPTNPPIECGIGGCTYSSPWANAIGRHKQSVHGIPGSSVAAVAMRRAKAEKTNHKAAKPTHHRKATNVEIDPLLGHVTFFAGYITRAVEDYARGHDLPTESFTRRVGKHLSAS